MGKVELQLIKFEVQDGWIDVSKTHVIGPSEMTFGPIKKRELCNVKLHHVFWAKQKTEYFVFPWLFALAVFDVTCFPAFVRRHLKHFQ